MANVIFLIIAYTGKVIYRMEAFFPKNIGFHYSYLQSKPKIVLFQPIVCHIKVYSRLTVIESSSHFISFRISSNTILLQMQKLQQDIYLDICSFNQTRPDASNCLIT